MRDTSRPMGLLVAHTREKAATQQAARKASLDQAGRTRTARQEYGAADPDLAQRAGGKRLIKLVGGMPVNAVVAPAATMRYGRDSGNFRRNAAKWLY